MTFPQPPATEIDVVATREPQSVRHPVPDSPGGPSLGEGSSAVVTTSEASPAAFIKKPRPNHQRTLQILKGQTPAQKLAQVFQLNERVLGLMRAGLRQRFPHLTEEELHQLYLQMRTRCHNRTS